MDISAEKVRELREKSGAGMMDCKRALAENGGDLTRAMDYLRKEGTVKAAKKAGRATAEGLIGLAVGADKKSAALIEVNCETDFVARTDQFLNLLNTLAEKIVVSKPANLDALLTQKLGDMTVQETLANLIAKVGENMTLRRFRFLTADAGEVVAAYVHAGSKIGVLVRIKGEKADELLARDVAMHIAAMSPPYIDRSQIPASVIEREKEISKASPDLVGKPANILDKILEGKLNRYFSEVCLVDQPFIKDTVGKKTVGAFLKEKASGAQIIEMVRFQVGEEIA